MPRPSLRSDQWWVHTRSDDAAVQGVLTAHLTAVIQFLLGPIEALSGQSQTLLAPDEYSDTHEPFEWATNDTVSYQAILDSGVSGVVHLSGAVAGMSGFRLEIFGERGQFRLSSPLYSGFGPTEIVRLRAGGEEVRFHSDAIGAGTERSGPDRRDEVLESNSVVDLAQLAPLSMSRAFSAFRDASLANRDYGPNFGDGVHLHRVLEAIDQSWATRRWVTVKN
jgi:predicted dehydrogenase